MIPVFQTRTGFGGNCLAAALASILELKIDEVPETATDRVKQMNDWAGGIEQDTIINTFLHDKGLILHSVWYQTALDIWKDEPKHYGIGGCRIKHNGLWHSVIVKDGKVVHDPHENSNRGEIEIVTFLIEKELWYEIQAEKITEGDIENFMDPKPTIEMVGS